MTNEVTAQDFQLSTVTLEASAFMGRPAFAVRMPSAAYQNPLTETLSDRANLAWLPFDFHNGVIECALAATLAADAPAYARGFIGIGFRIDAALAFEGLYLRPANSRVDDQVRRNHSVQYFSLPGYSFERFRAEAPEKYESYADMGLAEWLQLKIVVRDQRAELYLNGQRQPCLVVTDLKLGALHRGGVGFWIESGTVAYFADLQVTPAPA